MFTKRFAQSIQPAYLFIMNAEANNQPCQCEMCQPNWHMGRDDEFFESQPAERAARQTALEDDHSRKLARALALAPAAG